MNNQLPPYSNFIVCDAMVKERTNQTPRLRVARRVPEFAGLPLRRRVCANCGKLFLGWGVRLLESARLPQYDIEERQIALK